MVFCIYKRYFFTFLEEKQNNAVQIQTKNQKMFGLFLFFRNFVV